MKKLKQDEFCNWIYVLNKESIGCCEMSLRMNKEQPDVFTLKDFETIVQHFEERDEFEDVDWESLELPEKIAILRRIQESEESDESDEEHVYKKRKT